MSEEQVLQQRSSKPRLFQLDALRGLAAVSVVVYHVKLAFPAARSPWPLEIVSDGGAAVILFFVLSGYVLSLPYWSGRTMPYLPYLVRRYCRIYLPFAAAAALSILGAYLFRNVNLTLTDWFSQTWHTPITPVIVIKQFLMVPLYQFNTAFWSLTYEMQMSIAMPLLCIAMARTNPALFTLALGALAVTFPYDPTISPHYPRLSLQVAFLFALGAVLARYGVVLRSAAAAMGRCLWLLLAASLLLYFHRICILSLPEGNGVRLALGRHELPITGLGAAGIILCALHLEPLARILRHSVPEYLGRISYSLYLTHAIVLFALVDLLFGHMRWGLLLALIAVCAFGFAHVFCIAVEEPSMRLGKRLTAGSKRNDSSAAPLLR